MEKENVGMAKLVDAHQVLFVRKQIEMDEINNISIKASEPIGFLSNESIHARIAVYSKISLFKRFMIKWCFGLEYTKYK